MQQRCRLDVYYPTDVKSFATVVWFHGGGLTNGNRFIPEGLKGKEIAVVAANYRLSPRVKSPAYIEDAAAAVAWTFRNIEKYGGSCNRIFVSGHQEDVFEKSGKRIALHLTHGLNGITQNVIAGHLWIPL
jgi:acetyl esterase/lipase